MLLKSVFLSVASSGDTVKTVSRKSLTPIVSFFIYFKRGSDRTNTSDVRGHVTGLYLEGRSKSGKNE